MDIIKYYILHARVNLDPITPTAVKNQDKVFAVIDVLEGV